MKKFSVLLAMAAIMVSSSVFAGSLDYISNQSAKFIMNTASTARTDGADIVAYNPAGTALMGEGFFIDVSNQTLLKYFSAEEKATYKEEYKQNEPTILLPNVYLVYNAGLIGVGKLAVYGQMGVTAGGGKIKWEDGSVGTANLAASYGPTIAALASSQSGMSITYSGAKTTMEASSAYYAFGGGLSYALLEDMISLSAGAKYVIAQRDGGFTGDLSFNLFTINVEDKYSYDAKGVTPVFGLDVKPLKELTLGVRYEMETKLEFEYTQDEKSAPNSAGNSTLQSAVEGQLPDMEGKKLNQNLPHILSVGAEYAATPEMTVGISSNIYFMSKADMEKLEKSFGTGYEIGLGASYKVMDPLKICATFMYTNQGVKSDYFKNGDTVTLVGRSANPTLNSIMGGLGAIYTVIPNLDLSLGFAWTHYLPEDVTTTNGLKITYSKDIYMFALGAGYKI